MQSFLLHFSLKNILAIQLKFTERVTESVSICRWEVHCIENINPKFAHVVDALAGVKLHLDWYIFQADFNAADPALIVFEFQDCRIILHTLLAKYISFT
jgi:hypothetical protein